LIVLDTHAWIWLLAEPARIGHAAREVIDDETGSGARILPVISVWELFMLVKKGRLELAVDPAQFVSVTEHDRRFRIHPLSPEIARRSVELPEIHADPADRMIIATALELGCPVITRDARFADYSVKTVW
jgi:PIN domain nuclease of toxin-antitoxin system